MDDRELAGRLQAMEDRLDAILVTLGVGQQEDDLPVPTPGPELDNASEEEEEEEVDGGRTASAAKPIKRREP